MSASTQCPHSDVHFHLNQAVSGDTPLRTLEISGHCKICNAPMHFRSDVVGSLPTRPTASPDGTEARLPFVFGDEHATGKEVGFVVRAQA